jgi:hypothetical protein
MRIPIGAGLYYLAKLFGWLGETQGKDSAPAPDEQSLADAESDRRRIRTIVQDPTQGSAMGVTPRRVYAKKPAKSENKTDDA